MFQRLLDPALFDHLRALDVTHPSKSLKALLYYLTHVMDRCIRPIYLSVVRDQELPKWFKSELPAIAASQAVFSVPEGENFVDGVPPSPIGLFKALRDALHAWDGYSVDPSVDEHGNEHAGFVDESGKALLLLCLQGLCAEQMFYDVPRIPVGECAATMYLPALGLPDGLLAFMFLMMAAIPRALNPTKSSSNRRILTVKVGPTADHTVELVHWLFNNISDTMVSSSHGYLLVTTTD